MRKRGAESPNAKATQEERDAAVYRVVERGETCKSVAACFGVSAVAVQKWVHEAGWVHGWRRVEG